LAREPGPTKARRHSLTSRPGSNQRHKSVTFNNYWVDRAGAARTGQHVVALAGHGGQDLAARRGQVHAPGPKVAVRRDGVLQVAGRHADHDVQPKVGRRVLDYVAVAAVVACARARGAEAQDGGCCSSHVDPSIGRRVLRGYRPGCTPHQGTAPIAVRIPGHVEHCRAWLRASARLHHAAQRLSERSRPHPRQ